MANPELKKYIDKSRQQGFSDEVIRQELLKVGWNSDDVNMALSPNIPIVNQNEAGYPTVATETQAAQISKHKPILLLGVMFGFFLMVASAAIWLFVSTPGLKLLNRYYPTIDRTLLLMKNSTATLNNYAFEGEVTVGTSTPHAVTGFLADNGDQKIMMSYLNTVSTVKSPDWLATIISAAGKMYGQDLYDSAWHNIEDGVESRLPVKEVSFVIRKNIVGGLCGTDKNKLDLQAGNSALDINCLSISSTTNPFKKIDSFKFTVNPQTYEVESISLSAVNTKDYPIQIRLRFKNQNNENENILAPTAINTYGDFLARESLLLTTNQGKYFDYFWNIWEKENFNCTQCVNQMADSDNDGLNNDLEFLFGANPNKSSSGALQMNDYMALSKITNPVTGRAIPEPYASSTLLFLKNFKYESLATPSANSDFSPYTIRSSTAVLPVEFKSTAKGITLQYKSNLPAGDYITVFIGSKPVNVIILDGIEKDTRVWIPVSDFAGTTNDFTVILNPYGKLHSTLKTTGEFTVDFPNLNINPFNQATPLYVDATSAPLGPPQSGANDWAIGTNRVIEWYGPADTTYTLVVVDSKTNQTLGIIGTTLGAEAGDKQHGYGWVVGDYIIPAGSVKKTLKPGKYIITATYAENSRYMILPVVEFTAH